MNTHRTLLMAAIALVLVNGMEAAAQISPDSTRFTITGAPVLLQPQGEFRSNISRGFGADGGLLYHLDRPGFVSLRFDFSGAEYGREKKREPLSETVGGRILVDVTTTNSILTLGFGPELAWPRGRLRPYVNTGFSELFFRTSTSVKGTNSTENLASTTNEKDAVAAWVLGGGVRVPLVRNNPNKAISLDFGVRYLHGGVATYLREGSIQDLPDGSIRISPLSSRTPTLIYLIGVQFRIPHNPLTPCPRLIC
jgi:hypothetical protein